MKLFRIFVFLFICLFLVTGNFEADAGWKSVKKKVVKPFKKEKKQKNEETVNDGKIYAENFGTGIRKKGGTYAGFLVKDLQDSDNLQFKCISGKCNSATVHGRTSRGSWTTLYQGQLKEINVGAVVGSKRSSYTHLFVSVNGAHESYDKTAAKMEIIKVAGKTEIVEVVKEEEKKKQNTVSALPLKMKLNEDMNVVVGDPGSGTETAFLVFTVTKSALLNYMGNVYDATGKGYFNQQLFTDTGYSQEIKGDGNWDMHPAGGRIYFKNYKLKAGTYYLKITKSNKSGDIKVSVTVFEYDRKYDSERY